MPIEILNTVEEEFDTLTDGGKLENWVQAKLNEWSNFYTTNYEQKDDEYYRIWRGIWAKEDVERQSERSRLVSPHTQQAVESAVAEVEEATFGRGKAFRIDDDVADQNPQDLANLEELLEERFSDAKVRRSVAECLLNAAIFGYAAGEVVVDSVTKKTPSTQELATPGLQSFGITETEETLVKLRPINTRSVRFDPSATSIDEALGFGIDEFVPRHTVEELQTSGVYRNVFLGDATPDIDIEADKELDGQAMNDRVRLCKYFGKVPKVLLEEAKSSGDYEETVVLFDEDQDEDTSVYVEALIVIGNGKLLKAEENPYMMADRPIVEFSWEDVPGLYRGRGVVEKGYNTQKAIDAEMRSRIDGLALTTHPMLAMDARRLPRNGDFKVRPGKTILTQGDPREILHSFNFGEMSQNTYAQMSSLERMHQSATGSVDSAGIAGGINNEATAAGISMSLGAIIKRHKRTLISFQDNFLIPFVQKAAWRYMQFDPESFQAKDYKFNVSSSIGIMAREYEVTQLVQLLQTISEQSPVYPLLLEKIVSNMDIADREEFIAALKQASQPTPEQQQAAQQAQQLEQQRAEAEIEVLSGQANEFNARAEKYTQEAQSIGQLKVMELKNKEQGDLRDYNLDVARFELDREELLHKVDDDRSKQGLKELEIVTKNNNNKGA